ncbi:MAG: hypothetical protein LBT44_05045 [Clostridiales bacterium]|nr:hypothetical protein [Clostridiales bacterium]
MITKLDFDVKRYDGQYADALVALANRSFGQNYLSESRLSQMASQDGVFLTAEIDGSLAGYCVFLYVRAYTASKFLKIPYDIMARYAGGDGRICYMKSMAVERSFRRTGLSDQLFAGCLGDAEISGIVSAWGSAWKQGDKVPMDRIMKNNGFSVYTEIPNFWADDKDTICPACEGPCRCAAVIYYQIFAGRDPQ